MKCFNKRILYLTLSSSTLLRYERSCPQKQPCHNHLMLFPESVTGSNTRRGAPFEVRAGMIRFRQLCKHL